MYEYAATTNNTTNKVTATATDPGAEITIMLGETEIENGESATWESGKGNRLEITVGDNPQKYTVMVTAYPVQTDDEEVTVDLTGGNVLVGAPTYSSTAIGAAITAVDLPEGQIESTGTSPTMVMITPVVADASSNDYVTAGITLDENNLIVSSDATKNFAVSLMVPPDTINPAKIEEVDAEHVKLPSTYIYVFENVTGTVNGLENEALTAGWNVGVFTVDKATYQDISGVEIVPGIDINDYLTFDPTKIEQMAIEGTSGSKLFNGVVYILP